MGLDNYAVINKENTQGRYDEADDSLFAGITLCGGMCSGGSGSASFRGKVYDDLVRAIAGRSLYADKLEPSEVEEIYKKFVDVDIEKIDTSTFRYSFTVADLKDSIENLTKFLKVCVDNNLAIVSWC